MNKKSLRKTKLSQKILCSILAASVLGITANFNAAEAADEEITTNEALKANKIAADANDTITFINAADTAVRGVVMATGGNDITISGYKVLNVYNQAASKPFEGDGLVSSSANIIVENVGTVNIGTPERVFNNGGQAIHGFIHTVSLENIGELNINSMGSAIMAQNTNLANEPDKPSVSIITTKEDGSSGNVNINTQGGAGIAGIMAASINDNSGIAGVSINAAGKVSVTADGHGVQSYDKDNAGYKGEGKTILQIIGNDGVDVTSNAAMGVDVIRTNKLNDSGLLIESANGNVNITGKTYGVYLGSSAGLAEADDLEKGINGNIVGNNVNITASDNQAIEIINSGTLNVASNVENGNITVNANDVAIRVKGDKSVLTIGSEELNNNIIVKGDIKAEVSGTINLYGNSTFDGEATQFITANNGTINLAGGTVGGVLNIATGSSVNLNGATFTADDIANDITGGGKVVLKDNGVLATTAGQVFTNGNAAGSEAAGNVTETAKGKVDFVSGTLNLTDAEYTLDYVQSAKDSLHGLTYGDNVNSTTGIVMSGTLISELGENQLDVDNASSVGDEVALDKVTVNATDSLIVGVSSVDTNGVTVGDVTAKDAVNNGFSAGSLNLAENSTGMIITDGQNVTLGGSNGGSVDGKQLVTVAGAVPSGDGVSVVVGLGANDKVEGVSKNAGSFTIGNALATSDTAYTLTGKVTVNADSELNVNGATTITGGVTLDNGALNVGNGVLTSDIKADGNVSIIGSAVVGTLSSGEEGKTNDNNTVINIGSADKAGNVTVTTADLNGATVFLDPAWKDGAEITDASKMAVAGTEGKVTADGKYVVGRNSVMSFGVDNNEKAQQVFGGSGLTWGKNAVTAGLYINGSVDLTNGAIVVDGGKTEVGQGTIDNGTFTAAANSVVMVDGAATIENAAVSGVSTVTVNESSKLYIDGAEKGNTYKVLAGSGISSVWANDNITSDNALLIFTGDNTDNTKFDVTASYDKINNVYGDNAVVIDSVVDKTLEVGKEGDAAFDFFNAAANSNNNATKDAQIAAFNSAANMGELAGVNHGTYSMSNAMTDAVAHHLSLATHGEQDKDIWAHYIHNKEDIDGMDLGGIEGSYDAQYNGIVVGSDLYKNGKVTAGVALSYADGNIDGSNVAATTKNDAEYYGASLYGRIDNGNSAILGDISYMHSDNDITQNNSGQEITASADADAFSIGIRAEQAYEAGAGKFVPYAGIRYMHLGAGNYDNSLGMSYDADDQNLWLLPVGVTYSAEVQSGDWTVKPIAEVGYVWTMGDRDTDQTVSLNGASDTFGFETADSGSFIGRLGIEAEKADVTYGLSYEYQKGDTVKANKWMVNLTYSF